MKSTRWCLGLLAGCAVKGSGVADEEVRDVGAFTAIVSAAQVDVVVGLDDSETVTVRCDDNLIDLIETEVQDDALVVKTPKRKNLEPETDCAVDVSMARLVSVEASGSGDTIVDGAWDSLAAIDGSGSGDIKVSGSLLGLAAVDASGSGDVTVLDVDVKEVALDSSGSGDLMVEGVADRAVLDGSGSGDLDALGLTAVEGIVDSSGSGDVRLTVTDHVTVDLSGSGDVIIEGDPPQTDLEDNGSGEIVVR